MVNGKHIISRYLLLLSFFFTASYSSYAVTQQEINGIKDVNAKFKSAISEVETELKEPGITINELKFLQSKLVNILDAIEARKNSFRKEINEKNELIKQYSSLLSNNDNSSGTKADDNAFVKKIKILRDDVLFYNDQVKIIDETVSRIKLLLTDIVYESLKNRNKNMFSFNTPFYEYSAWTDGVDYISKFFRDLKEDALSRIEFIFSEGMYYYAIYVSAIIILMLIVYIMFSVRIVKLLSSRLNPDMLHPVSYREMLSTRYVYIFARICLYAVIPEMVVGGILTNFYSDTFVFAGVNMEILAVVVLYNTIVYLLFAYSLASSFYKKSLRLLPGQLLGNSSKYLLYAIIAVSGGFCLINETDIVSNVLPSTQIMHPDAAALINFVIGVIICVLLLFFLVYVRQYMSLTKRKVIISVTAQCLIACWALSVPVLIFLGASDLAIEFSLDVFSTIILFSFYLYFYFCVRDLIPMVIDSVADLFVKTVPIASDEPVPDLSIESAKSEKFPGGREFLKYWLKIIFLLVIAFFFLKELVIAWGASPQDISRLIDGILFKKISIAGKATFSMSVLFAAVLSGLIVYYIFKIIQMIYDRRISPYTGLDGGTRHAIKTAIGYIGLLLSIVITIYTLGVSMTALTFIVSGLSVGIGFSLQELFKNFFSGFVLLIERPIKVGDILNIDGSSAKVKKIQIRCTILESSSRDIFVIPNSMLINHKVVNETTFPLSRVEIKVDISYTEDATKVSKLLKDAADAHPRVSRTFKSTVEFIKFNDYSVTLVLKAFVRRIDKDEVTSDLHFLAFDVLKRNNIKLLDPQQGEITVSRRDDDVF